MSPQLVLSLAILALSACSAFPTHISPKSQHLLSQLVPSGLLSHAPFSAPSSSIGKFSPDDGSNEEDFDESDDESSEDGDVSSNARLSLANLLPALTLDNDDLVRLRAGLWVVLSRGDVEGAEGPGEVLMGRGKRYFPGLNSLLVAQYLNHRNARLGAAGKWKRQPHLGFHGSRG